MRNRVNWIILLCFSICLPSLLQGQNTAEIALADQYFLDEEYESALELYEKLVKGEATEKNITRAVTCYEMLDRVEDAIKFLDKYIKKESDMVILPVIKAGLWEKSGKFKQATKLYKETIQKQLATQGHFMQVGSYLYQAGNYEQSLSVYQTGRKKLKSDYAFSGEIANIHKIQGNYELATEEYLNSFYANSSNLSNASLNILVLVDQYADAKDVVEQTLLKASDKNQDNLGLRTILYEFYVETENFFEAFIQVKSIDRLFKEDGQRVYEFAETMRNNKNYSLSNKAFDYLIERKKDSRFFYEAYIGKAVNGELEAFDNVPVDLEAVQRAIDDYETLLTEFGRSARYFEAIYRQANLMVFYLPQLDRAKKNLQDVTGLLPKDERWAKGMLLLGDIYLIEQSYNESKAAYTSVSEVYENGNPQIRAQAKYKLAQLSYYNGEFSLAQALLSAIKDNTSNDISNDAIQLNLLIIDNTGLDTTTTALEIFANAQLLSYQRRYDESLEVLDSLSYEFPTHTLADEIIWEKVNIFLKQNQIETALEFIDRLLGAFPTDKYGDDALYTKARIYDYTLNNPETAMKFYLEFLAAYQGSLYQVDVRKRVRELRQG